MQVLACDGAGVYLQLEFAENDGSYHEKIAMSLPAAVKLSQILLDSVETYLSESGEVESESTEPKSTN